MKQPPASKPKAKEPAKTEPSPANAPAGSTPGRVVWTYPRLVPGQDLDLQAQRGCVAIDGNRQILACLGKRLVAFTEHEEEPRELWDYPTRGHIPGSPIVGRDGNIRIHSGDGMLHCITPEGQKEFSAKVGEPLGWASPLVDNDNHTLISAYSGGLLKIDDKGTRTNQPFFRTRQKLDSTGVIHHGVLYIGGEDAFVYALRLAGSRSRNEWNQDKNHGKTEWFINTAIAYHDGLFVVAGRDEYLYGFDETGLQIWRLHLRGQMLGSPVIDSEGNIYVGVSLEQRGEQSTGTLICIKGTSQAVSWEYDAGAAIESTPVIGDDGVLYFGDNDGVVHAVNLDGQRQWTQNVGSPVRSAGAITPSKRVVFGTDRGCFVALASSSSGLAKGGWPKFLGTPQQSGTTGRR